MVESVKSRIWNLLKNKNISLVMLYDRMGNILWNKGRDISSSNVFEGQGFCKTYINESLKTNENIQKTNGVIYSTSTKLSQSAIRLLVKSVFIYPLPMGFFLYIDSGTKVGFEKEELSNLKLLVELLGDSIKLIQNKENDVGGIIGKSKISDNIKEIVLQYSLEDNPVLLLGETGVGKSHMAELIHNFSGRKGKFITAYLPSIQESLFESEMFGHKKGSFTGAIADKKGLIDEAEGGTIFLDEISEIPVSFQTKLLRFIETNKYYRLGETIEQKSDVRIIAATNKDLKVEVKKKRFREDLYYRLSIFEIMVPLLRDRIEDIQYFVAEKRKLLKGKKIGDGFYDALISYSWPGNIRELLAVLTRAGIRCNDPIIGSEIEKILKSNLCSDDIVEKSTEKLDVIWEKFEEGNDFWEIIKEPFLNRDLNRSEVKSVLKKALNLSGESYKESMKLFNLSTKEYKKFFQFIYKNKLQPNE